MPTNSQDIDESIKLLLEKLSEEFEIVKRQGFPARRRDIRARRHDVKIPEKRWRAWANELGMDYTRFEGVLKILEKEGSLEDYKFSPDYI
ncbi:MAG: hypothetical protein WCO16_03405 [bacterium]